LTILCLIHNHICSRQEVREEISSALLKNNKIRDQLWEERNQLLIDKIESSLQNKVNQLKITPATKDEFSKIQRVCDVRGEQIKNMDDKIDVLTKKIDVLIDRMDSRYADREQFIFWRNLLVGGILVSILTGVIALLLDK
jgi:hypothetical protein